MLLSILLLWMAGFLLVTDFSVPLRKARQFKRILVIFPHADDEAVTCGGTLHHLATGGSTVTLVLLTRGERGTPDATVDTKLRDIRMKESQAVATILGISTLIQEDFGDGELQQKKLELMTSIARTIEQEKPDLLITYDLSGFYGHPDHITCSEIITELKKVSYPGIPLWYTTLPKSVLARTGLPDDMN